MAIDNKSVTKPEAAAKTQYNLLPGYFNEEFDSEYVMTQIETEANRATRAFEQINQNTPPKGPLGKFSHWLSKIFIGD